MAAVAPVIPVGEPLPGFMPLYLPQHPGIDYSFDFKTERFLCHVPDTYTGREAFGLIVFIPGGKQPLAGVPADWFPVLRERRLLFICPQRAYNTMDSALRQGLAVVAALKMMETHKIDPARVYVAGLSGGARIASDLGFRQPELFRGTIQSCGSDFYRPVPVDKAVKLPRDAGKEPYGRLEATPHEVDQARRRVRFVLITGPKDFRYGNLLDIYNGGFAKDHFQAKLIDVPGMGHATCSASALGGALDFIEKGK